MGYMNEPVTMQFTDNDIMREYILIKNIRKVAKIYDLPVSEVRKILKRYQII